MQVDNAYWLWTFQGRLLQKNNKDRFCQLLWRPRPPSLLSADQIKVNKANLTFFTARGPSFRNSYQVLTRIWCVCLCVCVCEWERERSLWWQIKTPFLTPRMRAALQLLIPTLIWGSKHPADWCRPINAHIKPWGMNVLSWGIFSVTSQMIKKDLKKYSKIFEQKDRLSQSKASKVWRWFIFSNSRLLWAGVVSLGCVLRSEICFCLWVGAGGQAQGHDGGLPSLQGWSSEDLPGAEEHPIGT